MKKRLLFLFLGAIVPMLALHAQAQVAIIANPNVAAADVSKAELHDIFTGTSSSLKGSGQVTPVLLKQGAAHESFLGLYVGKSDSAFRASWRSLLFSGQSAMPKTLDSDAAVVEYVSHNPGTIGYIAKTSPHEGVKILAVR